MKHALKKLFSALFIPIFSFATADVITPEYTGGITGGFTWLNMKAAPTDGDLEAGTVVTLTDDPANLSARLQQLQPRSRGAFRVDLGYEMPCTNFDFCLNYFHYNPHDQIDVPEIQMNQIIQNFLGASYSTLNATSNQRVSQIDFTTGMKWIIDRSFTVHPYIGIGFANINRKVDVQFTDLVLSPNPSNLWGKEKSDFYGIGPLIGTDFSCPLFYGLSFQGKLGGGLFFGRTDSKVDSKAINGSSIESYNVKNSYSRAVPVMSSQLALVYRPNFQFCCKGVEIKVGYEFDYYFRAVDRIDPFDGYVVNPDTYAINTSSNLGLGGPFVQVSVINYDDFCYKPCFDTYCGEFYGAATLSFLKPLSNNNDLVYANVQNEESSKQKQKVHFNHSFSGLYKVGFKSENNYDLNISYFHLSDQNHDSIRAQNNERITSVDASGPIFISFSEAKSKASYHLDQIEGLLGKSFSPFCPTELLFSVGLRYTHLKRVMNNAFSGGEPPETTSSKKALLKSNYYGLGPVFSLKPSVTFFSYFQVVGQCSFTFLMGHIKSSLDQENVGSIGNSSNTLRTPKTRTIVPIVDLNGGLGYSYNFDCGISLNLEAGYQFSDYFRAINLVYPVFLTGLEQRSSDLRLHGPYLKFNLGF